MTSVWTGAELTHISTRETWGDVLLADAKRNRQFRTVGVVVVYAGSTGAYTLQSGVEAVGVREAKDIECLLAGLRGPFLKDVLRTADCCRARVEDSDECA